MMMSVPTFVWYNESSDFNWLPGHWLSELDPPGEGSMYYQDSGNIPVVSSDINLPYYLGVDDGILFGHTDFLPQALPKVVIIGVVVSVVVSTCAACVMALLHIHPPGGSDAFAHCMGGCYGSVLCQCLPFLVGIGSEVSDLVFGGTVEARDVINTEIGWVIGTACKSNPLGRMFWKSCCKRGCSLAERGRIVR